MGRLLSLYAFQALFTPVDLAMTLLQCFLRALKMQRGGGCLPKSHNTWAHPSSSQDYGVSLLPLQKSTPKAGRFHPMLHCWDGVLRITHPTSSKTL